MINKFKDYYNSKKTKSTSPTKTNTGSPELQDVHDVDDYLNSELKISPEKM